MNYMNKKYAVLVFFVTFLIFSPTLFNSYVGDDINFLEGNTFYYSLKNIPRLVEKGYISSPRGIILRTGITDVGSGSFSYRPIGNLTYFFDHYFFRSNPFGSHLINILIHALNSVLVYWIVALVLSSPMWGFFASLLFSLHPIQSEAVANVSCRFDLLAGMFVLSSFCFWINFAKSKYVRKGFFVGALAMYFLALFSKESSITLPLVLILFDQTLVVHRAGPRKRSFYYFCFISILIFYLYIYFFVFPSVNYSLDWIRGSFLNHCLVMGYIWINYMINVLMPWTVKVIPGNYYPPAPGLMSWVSAGILLGIFIFTISLSIMWQKYKEVAFFLIWYIIFYLPVSNLLHIANPMADRFMYLPSIGLLIVLASFLHTISRSKWIQISSPRLPGILCFATILICVSKTVFINEDWKNGNDEAWAYIRDYPADDQGYALLGSAYYNAGYFDKAKEYLEKSVVLGDKRPREVFALAKCYIKLGNLGSAEILLKQLNLKNPDYDEPYFALEKIYVDRKDEQEAQQLLKKAAIYLSADKVIQLRKVLGN